MLKYSYLISLFSLLYFSSLISIVSFHSILLFSHPSCVCALHCNSIYESILKMRIITREVIPASQRRGKIYKTNESKVYLSRKCYGHIFTHDSTPTARKQVGVHSNREEPPHPLQAGGCPCGHSSSTVLSCTFLGSWLRHLTKNLHADLFAMALCSASTILYLVYFHDSPLFHSSISLLCW